MKTYDEIKDIITNRLGLRDQATYKAYIDQFHRWHDPRVPTEEEIELLSPDAIDNNAFWRVVEEIFQTDPVSNCDHGTPASVEEANRRNMGIYHYNGFTGLIENLKIGNWWPQMCLLEIGPGYGAFRDWFRQTAPAYSYHAADCYPRIDGVDATLLNGRLAPETKARIYNCVIASNVFQHLSVAQRRDYYRDIAGCLSREGRFRVSMMLNHYNVRDARFLDARGRQWCKHYGQFTEIQRFDEMRDDLQLHFIIIASTISRDGQVVFECARRDPVASPESILEGTR